MFTVTCDKCGAGLQLDEARVPPSGMVKKCPTCGQNLTVMPPLGGVGQELDLDFGDAPPTKDVPSPMARGPALAAFDSGGELELESHPDIIDLPAPKGPTSSKSTLAVEPDIPDLLAPVGPTSQRGITDLPAPVGPRPTRGPAAADVPDLLAPVGPTSQRNNNVPDLLAPVGPRPTRGPAAADVPDLLAPVGPTSSRNLNVPDLLAPVGPVPTKNVPDLLTPVGPVPKKNVPDLLQPVGPKPTKGVDLPAPKGFFDDLPQAKPGAGSGPPPDLSLDALDLVPMEPAPAKKPAPDAGAFSGPPPATGMMPSLDLAEPLSIGPPSTTGSVPSLDLGPAPPPPAAPGLSLDALDLVPPGDGGKSGPKGSTLGASDLDLEIPSSSAGAAPPGVVSFGKPTGTIPLVPTTGVQPTVRSGPGAGKGSGMAMLDLAEPAAAKKPMGTTAAEPLKARPAAASATAAVPSKSKRARLIAGALLGVLVLGGGAAFYVKTRMDAAEALAARVKSGLSDARRLLVSDENDHWSKAYDQAKRVLADDGKNAQALGLAAQAQLAWAIDSGQNLDARKKTADKHLNDAVKVAAAGPEVEKARALAQLLDDRAPAAEKALANVQRADPRDPDAPLYLGWAALAARDYPAAKSGFESALKLSKDRVPALYGLGQAQLALGDSAGAKASFDKVLAKRTNHMGAWVGVASMLPKDRVGTREKRFMEIVSSAEAANANPHDVARAWTLAGSEALDARRWDDATFRFKRAEDFDKDNVDAIAGRGLALLAQGNTVEARKLFEDANRRDPKHTRALIGLTRLALAEGKFEIAKDYMGQALEANQNSAEVQMWYGRVLEQTPGPAGVDGAIAAYKRAAELEPDDYEPVVALSLLYLKAGKNDEALATLSHIQKEAEGDAFLANTLGLAYLSANNLDKAESWFRGALAVDGKNVDAHANLGVTLEKKGDLAGALAELETANKIDPTREDVAIQLAMGYERDRRPEVAEKLYLAMIDDKSGKAPTIAARAAAGRFYARRGDLERAGKLGESILGEDPHHPAGLFLRGSGELAAGKVNEAQKDFTEAVAIDPQPQYYEALGRSYEAQNQLDDAIAQYTMAAERDKQYVDPIIDRARVRQTRREWKLSLDDLDAARKLDDRRAEIYFMKAKAFYTLGDKKAAIAPAQEAIARDGKHGEAFFVLGSALYDLNRPGEAVANLKKAIELAPNTNPRPAWFPEAHRTLGYAYRATHSQHEMCTAFRTYLEVAPPTSSGQSDIKQILLACP
jgi:tetratricopeptide (TPR) repeat protein